MLLKRIELQVVVLFVVSLFHNKITTELEWLPNTTDCKKKKSVYSLDSPVNTL